MSQTSYQVYADRAVPGDVYDVDENTEKNTLLNAANNTIFFGRMVVRKTGSAGQCDRPSSAADVSEGVAIRDINQPYAGYYPTYAAVAVLKKGKIWVEVDQAVTPDDPVYVRFDTGNAGDATLQGVFRKDDDKVAGNPTAVLLTGAKYMFVNSQTNKDGVLVACVDLTLS
jgi:hypothetical protein